MNANETLLFIGRCLSLAVHPERTDEIRTEIQTGNIDWEKVVWIGSSHFVLPALFVQFRNNELLKELPEDLVEYLEEIYQLNLARNQSIKSEAFNIISTLNSIGINPIFLKGTAHILDGLYSDIGERMIGDIDFLLPEEDIIPAVGKLKERGYFVPREYEIALPGIDKHYPRLQNENTVAAIEIHRRPVYKYYSRNFGFNEINQDKKKLFDFGEAYVLSDYHQIIHNMINAQLNDRAYYSRSVQLRNIYDLLLLSQRRNLVETVNDFGNYLEKFNAYFFIASKYLNEHHNIKFIETESLKRYSTGFNFLMKHSRIHGFVRTMQYLRFRIGRYLKLIGLTFSDKSQRKAYFEMLTNRNWIKAHLDSWRRQ